MVENIYQIIGDKVYNMLKPQTIQKFSLPREVAQLQSMEADSTILIDKGIQSLNFAISINAIPEADKKGNNDKVKELVEFIKTNQVAKPENIGYNFKVIIDYSVIDENNAESRSVVVKSVNGKDMVNLIPHPDENTVDYRRVKMLDTVFNFYLDTPYIHRIISDKSKKFIIRINNVAVYQNLTDLPDSHESNYNVALDPNSQHVAYLLVNHIKVYESSMNKVRFHEVSTYMRPNMLSMHIQITLGGYTDVFKNEEVKKHFKEG